MNAMQHQSRGPNLLCTLGFVGSFLILAIVHSHSHNGMIQGFRCAIYGFHSWRSVVSCLCLQFSSPCFDLGGVIYDLYCAIQGLLVRYSLLWWFVPHSRDGAIQDFHSFILPDSQCALMTVVVTHNLGFSLRNMIQLIMLMWRCEQYDG